MRKLRKLSNLGPPNLRDDCERNFERHLCRRAYGQGARVEDAHCGQGHRRAIAVPQCSRTKVKLECLVSTNRFLSFLQTGNPVRAVSILTAANEKTYT